jgi:NADPH:quinone reductase-like Zn-dependent oxidoreductase
MPTVVRFHELGGPEHLRFEQEATRELAEGEVRLRVQASGLNRAESMYYHGTYMEKPELPSRLGYEVAGIVEAVGAGVDPSWMGKSVSTIPGFSQGRYGTLGEEAIVPATVLSEYPPNLTPTQGAAIWMQYLTAWGALIHVGGVKAGDFVSIPAASSSVGIAAIQIVQDAGATAIALTRTATKRDELRALGAPHVIVLGQESYGARIHDITGGQGVRLTFDPVAGPFIDTLAGSAALGGMIIEYGALSGEPTPFPMLQALTRFVSVRGYTLHEIINDPELVATAKKYVWDRLVDGRFVPQIARAFPFEQTPWAYRYLESNQQVGKVVITFPERSERSSLGSQG